MRPKINQKELFDRVIKNRESILLEENKIPDTVLPRRPGQTYTGNKLDKVRSYLYAYSAIISNNFERFWYVETCSGPGVIKVKDSGRLILGTPLLAMTNEPYFTGYRFIEQDQGIANALKERHKRYCPDLDVEVIVDDCNDCFERVLSEIPSDDHVFVVMDPEGLELKWEKTVVPAARMKCSELFINFPYDMAIKRCINPQYEATERTLTECLGTEEWKDLRDKYNSREITSNNLRDKFVQLYVSGLQRLGLKEVQVSRLVRSDNNLPLYFLISASRERVAKDIMKDIMKVEVTKQEVLF